jgi:hypothetical protein
MIVVLCFVVKVNQLVVHVEYLLETCHYIRVDKVGEYFCALK